VSDPQTFLTTPSLNARWLGRVSYSDGLALQEELVSRKVANSSEPDHLLLLEHEPVYTIGRTPDQTSLREASALPHPVHVINRGGQATYHGPGQLVGYPILDLGRRGRDLHVYLRAIEDLLLEVCASFGVDALRREGLTGLWVGNRKLASIGVGVRRWISMHGFALNVTDESLSSFAHITPCGIGGVQMTSLQREAASGASPNARFALLEANLPSNPEACISVIEVAGRVAEFFTQNPVLAD
jgi:lipoyl(octanoyl) transferase